MSDYNLYATVTVTIGDAPTLEWTEFELSLINATSADRWFMCHSVDRVYTLCKHEEGHYKMGTEADHDEDGEFANGLEITLIREDEVLKMSRHIAKYLL